MASDYYIHDD